MPAIAKILVVFFAMLGLARIGLPLGLALMAGGIGLNIWVGFGLADTAVHLLRSLMSADVWLMTVITVMVVEFGRFMTEKRNADALLGAISHWGGRHGKAWSLMALPAVIGLIPMPAGALFSAPLVGQAASGMTRPDAWKAAVNYWFRHVWEYWWILYPGVIVALRLFEMAYWRFFATLFPLTLVTAGMGYAVLVRPHLKELAKNSAGGGAPPGRRLAMVLLPIGLVAAGVLTLPPWLEAILPDARKSNVTLFALLISLIAGLAIIVRDERRRDGKTRVFSTVLKPKSLGMLLTIAGVMVFQHMLEFSGMVGVASQELQSSNVGLVYVVAGLPFLAGLITGIAVGFVSASFPFVVGLLNAPESGLTPMATLMLAYGFGYMGMMVSPVHLCLLVTREYFGSSLRGIYKRLAPCVLAVLATSVLGYALLRMLGL